MDQVAWILVGDPKGNPTGWRPQPPVEQEFRGVLDGCREGGPRLPSLLVIPKLKLVLFHVRAAAGCVDDDRVEALAIESVQGARRQPLRGFRFTGVRG